MKNYFIKIQIALVLSNFVLTESKLSDQRLCADPDCSVLLGVGKTVLKYFAKDEGMLSFANNKPVKIFSKGAGSNPNLWGVMIDGKRGYVNKAHVQEQRVYRKDLEFTIPTEFAEPAPIEENGDAKAKEEEIVPYEAEIQKTEQLEDGQLETKEPELKPSVEVPVPEVSSSLQASVETVSISTPPIDSSTPPSAQQPSAAPQPVQPDSSVDYEVVDGTTIYFDGPPPKINEAPSMDNVTPEAISPTMTQARAEPTESSKAPEIESSVSDNLGDVEKAGTAVLSDNPGGTKPTVDAVDGKSEDMDSTEPITEEIKTAAYDLGSKDLENIPMVNMADKIQVDKPIEEVVPFTTEEESENKQTDKTERDTIPNDVDKKEIEEEENTSEEPMVAEEMDEDEMDEEEMDEEEEGDNDYIDDLSEENRMKLQQKIEEMKMQSVDSKEKHSETKKEGDINSNKILENKEETDNEIVTNNLKENNPMIENNEQEDIPYSAQPDTEENPTIQTNAEVAESIEKFTVEPTVNHVETLHSEESLSNNDVNDVPTDTPNKFLDNNPDMKKHESAGLNTIDVNQNNEAEVVNTEKNLDKVIMKEEHAHEHDQENSNPLDPVENRHEQKESVKEQHLVTNHEQTNSQVIEQNIGGTGNANSPQDHTHDHHGHGHNHNHHSHGHTNDHHGHSHDHHVHGNTNEHHAHEHTNDPHGHGHSHNHYEHGHSHDHDHSHGIGHLGKGVKQRVPEAIPSTYKPAQQKFELPLSAQFGTPPPSDYTTMPPAAQPYEEKTLAENVSEETLNSDLLEPPVNVNSINDIGNTTPASDVTNEEPVIVDGEENLEPKIYQTPSPLDNMNIENYTPPLETTPSPDIEIENTYGKENNVEESTIHDFDAGYMVTESPHVDIEKTDDVVEESGGFFASIFSFFSSGPDRALQDAINTPPVMEVKVKGEDPEAGNANLEANLNEENLQTNSNDKDDKLNEQLQKENEQLISSGDGSNGMGDVDSVMKDDIHVDPAGKELEATFYEKDDILVVESPEIVEKLEETLDITSTDTPINDIINEGTATVDAVQNEQINQVEQSKETSMEQDGVNPSLELENMSLGENKEDIKEEPEIENSKITENKDIDNIFESNHHKDSSDNLIPEWLTVFAHDQGFVNSDRIALVGIIAITLLLLHFINTFMDRSTREKPLIRRIAEMDRKLFSTTNEVLILRKEMSESGGSSMDSGASVQVVREMELQLEQVRLELETSRQSVQQEAERYNMTLSQLEISRQEVSTAQEEAKQSQEMVEELLANQKDKAGAADEKLMEVVQQLQTQLESQKSMLLKYEPKLKKKEKENKEITKQLKQMRADVANANLETEKIKKELAEELKIKDESTSKLAEMSKNESEWQSLTDILQSQLDEKNETVGQMESEMASLRSRISVFKNESESKEEQLEILQETLDELQNRKTSKKDTDVNEDANGWEVEEDGWEVDEINEVKEVARLRIENKKNLEQKERLAKEMTEMKIKLETASTDLDQYKKEATTLREARDEVIKEQTDVQRRLDVLTEFFNKKEAELQKQLGLQSAKFGDVSTDAESTARQLISVTNELESTQEQLKIIKGELDDQEKSLKASVAGQEKKAHENWVAARQAERKLTELQGEMSLMRNKLTIVESKNTLLEQEKDDLTGTLNLLKTSVKPEPVTTNGVHTSASLDSLSLGQGDMAGSGPNSVASASFPTSPSGPESLPPLPGLPGISSLSSGLPTSVPGMPGMPLLANPMSMVPPIFQSGTMLPGIPPMLEMRQPPLGRMSPGPRDRSTRSFSSRSPSPEYERYRGGSGRYSNRDRDMSPSSRSERRNSPCRRGPSPTRSERNYRDRQYTPEYTRDRYYSRSNRDTSPDRYSTRSEQSERESPRESQRYRDRKGPKTSTPGDPQSRSYRA